MCSFQWGIPSPPLFWRDSWILPLDYCILVSRKPFIKCMSQIIEKIREQRYYQACPTCYMTLVCCCLVTKSRPTFCSHMDCSIPAFPVLHHLPEFAQTYVHWVSDAIHTSHVPSPPSPPALNLSQHQGLFQMSQLFASGGQSIGASVLALVLPLNNQGWFPF